VDCKVGVGECLQGAGSERHMLSKGGVVKCVQDNGTLSNVLCIGGVGECIKVLVRKGMWCVRGEFLNVYSVLVRKVCVEMGELVNVYSVLVR
jgi:hypothetical protein